MIIYKKIKVYILITVSTLTKNKYPFLKET